MVKVVIVDDHQIFVEGLKEIILTIPELAVVGEANDGIQLLDVLHKTSADIILMDISMPKMNGIEATQKVREKYPHLKILMLTMHDGKKYIEQLLHAGAHGYVLKNTEKEELQKAINTVVSGGNYYSPLVTQRIMESLHKEQNAKDQNPELSKREIEVLKLIVEENTTNEIAEKLFISRHTVESHRKNLISKLGVRCIAGLVKHAVDMGLVK